MVRKFRRFEREPYLAQELMPEPEWEMPCDLFCLLA
jgi:hypothetical protein